MVSGVPHLNFEGGSGVLLLNFEWVPLLNLWGVPGPNFKLSGMSWALGSEVPDFRFLVPLLNNAAKEKKIIRCAMFNSFTLHNLKNAYFAICECTRNIKNVLMKLRKYSKDVWLGEQKFSTLPF